MTDSGPDSDRLQDEVDLFCPACDYPLDAHERAGECPTETEVREWWGR